MAMFFYQAFSKDGKKVSGYIDAPSRQAVKQQLARKGIFPVKITQTTQDAQQGWLKRLFERKVTTKDKRKPASYSIKGFNNKIKNAAKKREILRFLSLLINFFPINIMNIMVALKTEGR